MAIKNGIIDNYKFHFMSLLFSFWSLHLPI